MGTAINERVREAAATVCETTVAACRQAATMSRDALGEDTVENLSYLADNTAKDATRAPGGGRLPFGDRAPHQTTALRGRRTYAGTRARHRRRHRTAGRQAPTHRRVSRRIAGRLRAHHIERARWRERAAARTGGGRPRRSNAPRTRPGAGRQQQRATSHENRRSTRLGNVPQDSRAQPRT